MRTFFQAGRLIAFAFAAPLTTRAPRKTGIIEPTASRSWTPSNVVYGFTYGLECSVARSSGHITRLLPEVRNLLGKISDLEMVLSGTLGFWKL
jgi:hypothetical protein